MGAGREYEVEAVKTAAAAAGAETEGSPLPAGREWNEGEVKKLPPLVLAYIGDAVYELRVREFLLARGAVKMAGLHAQAVALVCAQRQSQLYAQLEPVLTLEEQEVFRHGRNARSGRQPPHVPVSTYRRATGLEALIGYLHLLGREERLELIFERLLGEQRGVGSGE